MNNKAQLCLRDIHVQSFIAFNAALFILTKRQLVDLTKLQFKS